MNVHIFIIFFLHILDVQMKKAYFQGGLNRPVFSGQPWCNVQVGKFISRACLKKKVILRTISSDVNALVK